ncbi:MAG: hypothetical protein U0586_02080 [Candidatus Brocadiaceae bacterium]
MKNGDAKVEALKVMGMTNKYVTVTLSKKDVKSLNKQFSRIQDYPDVIVLTTNNIALNCKVRQILENTVKILIPTSAIASLYMTFPFNNNLSKPNGGMQGLSEVRKTEHPKETTVTESSHGEELGEQKDEVDGIRIQVGDKQVTEKPYRIKTKIRSIPEKDSLSHDKIGAGSNVTPGASEFIPEEGQEEFVDKPVDGEQEQMSESQDDTPRTTTRENPEKEKKLVQDGKLGRVEGKVFCGGKSLRDCQIKLQMLEKGGLLVRVYHPVEGAEELEASTDADGVYRFMNVPPGFYKLYWKPLNETSWIRRFKMEPDVIVEPGKVTSPGEIETLKRTLN